MATQPPKPQRRTRHSSRPLNGDGHPASIFVNEGGDATSRQGRHFVSGDTRQPTNQEQNYDEFSNCAYEAHSTK